MFLIISAVGQFVEVITHYHIIIHLEDFFLITSKFVPSDKNVMKP